MVGATIRPWGARNERGALVNLHCVKKAPQVLAVSDAIRQAWPSFTFELTAPLPQLISAVRRIAKETKVCTFGRFLVFRTLVFNVPWGRLESAMNRIVSWSPTR